MMAIQPTRTTRPAHIGNPEVDAYNHAFEAMGVEWRLDANVYARHKDVADPKARLCACIEAQYPHLLKVYDRDFIGNVVSEATAKD